MSLRTSLTSLGLNLFSCQWNTPATMSSSSTLLQRPPPRPILLPPVPDLAVGRDGQRRRAALLVRAFGLNPRRHRRSPRVPRSQRHLQLHVLDRVASR